MGQNALIASVAIKPNASATANIQAPLVTDTVGTLLIGQGNKSSLNNTAAAVKLVSATARRINKVIVNTAASATSAIYDSATSGAAAAGNLVFSIPQTAGIYDVDFPLTNGLCLLVGTAGVISLSYQ